MYKFKTASWHVKLFKWIFNEDPTKIYKSMCPYFWSYVLILLTLPLIVVVKMFGKAGTAVLNRLRTNSERLDKLKGEAFLEKWGSRVDITPKEAYTLWNSKEWVKFSYLISYKQYNYISKLKREFKLEYGGESPYVKFKKTETFSWLSYLTVAVLGWLIIHSVYIFFQNYEFLPVDWEEVVKVLKILSVFILIITFVTVFIVYIVPPLSKPFKFLWKGVLILGDMIYSVYKKSCPLIEWDSEN